MQTILPRGALTASPVSYTHLDVYKRQGTACDVILKKFGMELDRAYVFGDSMNDLSMFQYAKHTIAMGNHAKGLDPFTEYVTAEVEKDGIAQAIRHYGLD